MGLDDLFKSVKKEGEVIKGEETKDKLYASENTYPDWQAADRAFVLSKQKLFDVNRWSDLPGITSAFVLHDSAGQPKSSEMPQAGDYLLIDLPGPLPDNWVVITEVLSGENEAQFTVKPGRDPRQKGEAAKGEIEHFFGKEASSTFRVELVENTVRAMEIGRNEGINNHGPEAGGRALINTVVAEGGWAFFQRVQWKKLTDYLVHL